MEYNRLVIFTVLLFVLVQASTASLYIDIKLSNYSHNCDEDFWPIDSDCDPQFTLCLDRPVDKPVFSKDACQYAFSPKSSHFQNQRFIDFEKTKNTRGVPVPWVNRVDKILDNQILFSIYVDDDDTAGEDDHMVTLTGKIGTAEVKIAATEAQARYKVYRMINGGHRLFFKIRMYCHPHYYGSDCLVKCLAQNNANGHYTCEQSTGKKLCLKGWTGKSCDTDINECDLHFCRFGKCINEPGDYVCLCRDYFTGRNCTTMSNPCGSNPCQSGSLCKGDPLTFDYKCHCISGWEGKQCQIKSNPCLETPCLHMGTCQNSADNFTYSCNCSYGWEGNNCERRMDPCVSDPCQNGGRCRGDKMDLTYDCVCPSGWLGKDCQTKFEPCLSKPCLNDAQCDEDLTTHSYHCNCATGWEGVHCEEKSDPCLQDPCQNNATCQSSADNVSYICSCMFGWEGKDCEARHNPCDMKPCKNGAHCRGNSEDLTYICACSPGWEGENCNKQHKPCESSPCQNEATCLDNGDGLTYVCDCSPGWMGEFCEKFYNPCKSSPCQNKGNCQADPVSYTYNCNCTDGWEGDHCWVKSNPCLSRPCLNNATCYPTAQNFNYYCSCTQYFEGKLCETQIFDTNVDPSNLRSSQAKVQWKIPLAVIAAIILLAVSVIIFVFLRRRRNKSKLQYVSDTLSPVIVYQAAGDAGTSNLAFENNTYTQSNSANQQIEAGRQNQMHIMTLPTTPEEDDRFNPVKPSFSFDDEDLGAVGGVCRSHDKSTKLTAPKDSDLDSTDLKYSRISTLSRVNERADENPYHDFSSLTLKAQNKDESKVSEEGIDEEDEEDHYQELEDVIEAIRNSRVEVSPEQQPPALPPFNIGVQDNPLRFLSDNVSLDSDITDEDINASGTSHYQEPDDCEISPEDVYTDVIKKRHEEDTLPRRPHCMNIMESDRNNDTENDAHLSSPSSISHYDVPTGAGPKTADSHVYDNPRGSGETSQYDIPRSILPSSGSDFDDLFSNTDPWTPDPFQTLSAEGGRTNQDNGSMSNVYDNNESDDNSDEENQEDISQLRKEVEEFMGQVEPKEKRESSSFA